MSRSVVRRLLSQLSKEDLDFMRDMLLFPLSKYLKSRIEELSDFSKDINCTDMNIQFGELSMSKEILVFVDNMIFESYD